jgi:hypothetical protein
MSENEEALEDNRDTLYGQVEPEEPPTSEEVEADKNLPQRPEYVSEAHWDAEKGEVRVESLAKSFKDTKAALDTRRKEMGVPQSPDEYAMFTEEGNVKYPEGLDYLPEMKSNDPIFRKVVEAAHSRQVDRGDFEAIFNAFMEGQNEIYSSFKFDADEVLKGVNPDLTVAKNISQGVDTYMHSLELPEDEDQVVAELMASSGGVKLLARLMDQRGVNATSLGSNVHATSGDAENKALMEEWNELRRNDALLSSDPVARKRFEEIGKKLYG